MVSDRINLAGIRRMLSPEDWNRKLADHERSIAASWDALGAMLEDGTVSERILERIYDQEPAPGAHPLVVGLWAVRLRRFVDNPQALAVYEDAFKTTRCLCDHGWMPGELGGLRPCDRCEPLLYARWRDHWRDPAHSCSDCDGSRYRRRERTSASTPNEGIAERREDAHDKHLDELI